ncbi:MAG: hypothetical protein U5Q03_12190 [Bacteroidota bacterium]|nr:hypothetical protein [Bacteroidota bacterium]
MNKHAIISILLVLLIGVFVVSCSKDENENEINLATEVSGKYTGTINSSLNPEEKVDATINISRVDDATIQLDLMSEMMDTAFMLNLYENGDSVMVCFTENQFYQQYGHHLDEDHHMMNDEGHMSWDHHMNEQHETGDEHFGGFGQQHHSFHYRIVPANQSNVYYQFEGQKQ